MRILYFDFVTISIFQFSKFVQVSFYDSSDASFGYPGGPILFKNLNFGIDLDSRVASKSFSEVPRF